MNRTDLANVVLNALVAGDDDFAGSVWTKGGHVRVYVTDCGKDCGFVSIERDGRVTYKSVKKHGGAISRFADNAVKALGEIKVTDEFAEERPAAPARANQGDANHAYQVAIGTLDSNDF